MPPNTHTQRGHNSQVNCYSWMYQPATFLLVWALPTELASLQRVTLSIQEMQVLCSVEWGSGFLRTLLRLTNFRLGHACVPSSKMPPLPILFIPTVPASLSLLLEGKSPNVMTLMVGIYPNQSQTPCGAAGSSRSCYSGDPHCDYLLWL